MDAVELPPADCHLVAIGRINRNRGLVRRVAENVVATCIDIRLVTGEHAELRDHARRSLYFSRRRRRHVVFFERLVQGSLRTGASVCPETVGSTTSEVRPMKEVRVEAVEYLIAWFRVGVLKWLNHEATGDSPS